MSYAPSARAMRNVSRAQLSFRASELGPRSFLRTGQFWQLARASVGGSQPGTDGLLWTPAYGMPQWQVADADGDGVRDTIGLWIGPNASNLCLQSENFGTTWVATGTPTRVAAAKTCGVLVLDLLGDTNAAAASSFDQTFSGGAFNGAVPKALSVFVSQATATSSVIRLRDTTAATNRLLAAITWSGSVPIVTMTTGILIGVEAFGNGVYRIHLQATTVTTANAHVINVYPATGAALGVAAVGTIYVGGVQLEDAQKCNSYIKTTTGIVTSLSDNFAMTMLAPVQNELTLYAKVLRALWMDTTVNLGHSAEMMTIGSAPGARVELVFAGTAGGLPRDVSAVVYDPSGAGVNATTSIPSGAVIEVCAQLHNLLSAPQVRIDVGAGFTAFSGPVAPIPAWNDSQVVLGEAWAAAPGNTLDAALVEARIIPGAYTLAQARLLL